VREVCPPFPFAREQIHWSLPDPSLTGTTARATYPAFERTATELETRIRFRFHEFTGTSTKTRRPARVPR
jgi:hypothetical protein